MFLCRLAVRIGRMQVQIPKIKTPFTRRSASITGSTAWNFGQHSPHFWLDVGSVAWFMVGGVGERPCHPHPIIASHAPNGLRDRSRPSHRSVRPTGAKEDSDVIFDF